MRKITKHKLLPILVTLGLGFIPISVASILEKTFFFSSSIPHPMVSSPTLIFGDLLFLPIINTMIYDVFRANRLYGWIAGWSQTLMMLLISVALNTLTHLYWLNDRYIEFIDSSDSLISYGGIFHFAFSTIQTFYLLIFVTSSIRKKRLHGKNIPLIYWTLSLFFSISLFDVWIKGTIRHETITILYVLTNDAIPLTLATASFICGVWLFYDNYKQDHFSS